MKMNNENLPIQIKFIVISTFFLFVELVIHFIYLLLVTKSLKTYCEQFVCVFFDRGLSMEVVCERLCQIVNVENQFTTETNNFKFF
jgi:hypothetical protein